MPGRRVPRSSAGKPWTQERVDNVWKCSKRKKPTTRQEARGWAGSPCGRPAVVVWCRAQGIGSAFVARCHAHARPFAGADWSTKIPDSEDDFTCIPVAEFETFLAAKRVRAVLREKADPERGIAEFQEQQRAKYIDPTKVK